MRGLPSNAFLAQSIYEEVPTFCKARTTTMKTSAIAPTRERIRFMAKPMPTEEREDNPATEKPRVIDAAALFQGAREVWVELGGVRYRLRITRRNKVILQK